MELWLSERYYSFMRKWMRFESGLVAALCGVVALGGCSAGEGSKSKYGAGVMNSAGGSAASEGAGASPASAATGGSNSMIAIVPAVPVDRSNLITESVETPYCLPEPFPQNYSCKGPPGPWAEALQKALWFFNVNKSGPGVYCTDVQWRGDAHLGDGHIKLDPKDPNGVNLPQSFIEQHRKVLDPDGNGEVDLAGGYHDAGDYIKFTSTTAYAASMIAWSMYEYPEAFTKTGLAAEALGQVRWAADYFMKSTFLDEHGKLVAFAHQVADASDHSCFWMPPEVRRADLCPRKAYFVWEEQPAADVTAAAAAALALTGIVTYQQRKSAADVAYAEKCVRYAKALYEFAARHPLSRQSDDGGLYLSNSSTDDLAWAALWLYLVNPKTNQSYLDAIVGGDKPWLSFGAQANLLLEARPGVFVPEWAESSPHSWDSMRAGLIVKLAQIQTLRKEKTAPDWVEIARNMAEGFRTGGSTPDGFYVYMSWGSARYNAAAQFTSMLFAKYFPEDRKSAEFVAWSKSQAEYILGKNSLNKSFMMGYTQFTGSYANQPHHAAGHASIYGLPAKPTDNRHVLWGALVSGPTGDGSHVDNRDDYGTNEVTIDYNAALTAALAAHYGAHGLGECPQPYFPPLEEPTDEFYAMASINGDLSGCRTQLTVRTMNESIHPPRYDETLTVRVWFDASEVIGAGLDPQTAVTGFLANDTGPSATPSDPTELKGPIACDKDAGVYYFELDYTGSKFWGLIPAIGAPRDVLLDFGMQYAASCVWNPSNDWSLQLLANGEPKKTSYVTVYSRGRLIWGEEPPCMGRQRVVAPPPAIEYPPIVQ